MELYNLFHHTVVGDANTNPTSTKYSIFIHAIPVDIVELVLHCNRYLFCYEYFIKILVRHLKLKSDQGR